MRTRQRGARWLAPVLALLLLVAGAPFAARDARADAPSVVYFDATGQTLGNPFLTGWLKLGGLKMIGEPVSAPTQVDDGWVQWFKFGLLEVHKSSLDGATADDVQLGELGEDLSESLGLARWHPAFQRVEGVGWANQRFFPRTGHTIANAFKGAWEKNDFGKRLGQPISQEFTIGDTNYQFFQNGALSWSPNFGVSVVPLGLFDAQAHRQLRLTGAKPDGVPVYNPRVLASLEGLTGERWIDINLSSYTLTAYVGQTAVYNTTIVDGAPATPTVVGEFFIYTKLDKQTMTGFNVDGTKYKTEDVPWVMYFYQDWAIHGAYWRDSFGYSGSHGCVNLPVDDAAWLYSWADVGTRVEVHD